MLIVQGELKWIHDPVFEYWYSNKGGFCIDGGQGFFTLCRSETKIGPAPPKICDVISLEAAKEIARIIYYC